MVEYTRRTHIVRCADPKDGDDPAIYIDYEVLDAIAFRIENNHEVILSTPAAKAIPLIIDDTGGGHGVQNANPTRKSHMERIVGDDKTQSLDVEVIDYAAFRDQNNAEWILDMSTANTPFNVTEGTGSSSSTRRTHNEKKSGDLSEKDPTDFLTVERCDTVCFRKNGNKEVILYCPSSDDPNNTAPRASTFIWSPEGYDPTDEDGPKPPLNTDPNLYCQMVKDAGGFLTGKEKISQGPLWWIRKVKSGGFYLYFHLTSEGAAPGFKLHDGSNSKLLYDTSASTGTGSDVWYAWQPATSGVQVFSPLGGFQFVTYGSLTLQDSLAGITVAGYGDLFFGAGQPAPIHQYALLGNLAKNGIWPPGNTAESPFYASFDTAAEAQAYANFLNDGGPSFAGVTPQLTVGAISNSNKTFTRDVIIKCNEIPTTLLADITLAPNPKNGRQGTFSANAYTIDTTAGVKVSDDTVTKDTIIKVPFLYNSGAGSAGGATYTVKVARDTDKTDLVPPTKAIRLLVDVSI